MILTRREFGKLAATAIPAASQLANPLGVFAQSRKPNSLINGVQLGTITYSYRSMPDQGAEATLRYIVDSGISAIELMNGPAESYAGAPSAGRRGGGGGRGQAPTPEQMAAQRAAAAQLKEWRTSVSMDRFKALRKMYNDAGVSIYAWKVLTPEMSDEEFEYVFDVAEALGMHAHDARAADRRGATETDRAVRREAEDLRRLPHAYTGDDDRVR